MKPLLVAAMSMVAGLAVAGVAVAQDLAARDARSARVVRPEPGGILTPPSTDAPREIVAGFLRSRGVDAATAATLREGSARRDGRTGLSHVRLRQEVNGLEVYGAYARAAFNDRGELVHLIENLSPVSPAGVLRARIDAAAALLAALQELYPGQTFAPVQVGRAGNTGSFAGGAFFGAELRVTAVALPMTDNVLRAGYLVETWSREANDLRHTVVGGDGRVLAVESRTNRDSYKVFVEDPDKGVQVIVNGPPAGTTTASPSGWLSGSQTTVNITGNNTHAYLDADDDNAPDAGGTAVSDGNFLSEADLSVQPTAADNRNVAVQNLFYLNNRIHDRLHGYGFDEAAGNFQTSNFGRGGLAGDPVNAEAQDGGGVDNANFATPVDGQAPRMQMYLWTGKGDHQVLVGGGTFLGAGASFGPTLTTIGVSGVFAMATDSTAPTADACETIPAGQLTGRVAIVDRGTCNFTVKVRNAQAAGAIAVVVVNITSDSYFTMGGTDRRVRIPAVMVGAADGAAIKASAGLTGTTRRNPIAPLQRDGSLDSDIVFHEYCHGLTWRMIGSMSGALPGAVGEGMSDVCALLMNGDDRVGEYSASELDGIRRFRYAGYPNTYADVTGAEVHDDGEIYAAIGWRMWENFAGAGRTVHELFTYLVQGMNFTPAGPYFEDMRDGILEAIPLTEPEARCLVWDAFADYGVGVGARATVRGKTRVTITESTTMPPECAATP
ncbi:MAG: M36 family metallopeptidase [Vicinamibacterales bacterium]